MKPSFALNFTDDSIQLLHRTGKGWVPVGETPFAAPDLDDALDYMRKTALGLEPGGFTTKLVIPNSQIRYLEVEAPGPGDDLRRTQILTALEGRTPYAPDDLVFDWSGRGKTVRVAVLARETLEEAEGFAVTHKLNPLGFAAIPEDGSFTGEPWFGDAAGAAKLLPAGETVERDRAAIRILTREMPKAGPAPELSAERPAELPLESTPAPEPVPAPSAASPENTALSAVVGPLPDALPDAQPDTLANALPVRAAASADGTAREPDRAGDTPAAEAKDLSETGAKAAPETRDDPFPESETEGDGEPGSGAETATAMASAAPAAKAADSVDAAEEAPFTHVPDNPAFPEDEPEPPHAARPVQPAAVPANGVIGGLAGSLARGLDDDIPPAPPSAAMAAFASRRGNEETSRAPTLGAASRPDLAAISRAAHGKPVEDLPPMPRPPQASARPVVPPTGGLRGGVAKGFGALVTSPALSGAKKAKAKPGALPALPAASPRAQLAAAASAPTGPTDAAKSLTRPGGTFGTRPSPQRKSRAALFLALVAVLLLCLALVAAWSSFYLASRGGETTADPVAVATTGTTTGPETGADVPAVEDEMLADGEGDLIGADPAAPAAIDPATDPAADPAADPVVEAPAELAAAQETAAPAAEPAPDAAVSSDSPASQPLSENQDEIFLATSDSPPPALDALSLPAPETSADALPVPQMPPPPYGTVYAFDANGLLIPTPEGILSPEGVLLIAGKPPVVPPSRSAAAASVAAEAAAVPASPPATAEGAAMVEALPVGETAAATTETASRPAEQPNPDLADRRPKPRPDALVPGADDAALAVEPAVSFTSLRPRLRPTAILAAGERARQETESASLAAAQPAPEAAAETAAETEAQLAAAAAAEAANPSVVAISRRPAARPRDFSRAVEAAVAAAIRAPAPEPEPAPEPAPKKTAKKDPAPDIKPDEQSEIDVPEVAVSSAAPKIPTKASVAKSATYVNALNLSKINLIGVYGTQSKRYALIRQANGKYKKVKVGDRIDGGQVKAITQNEVRYQKGGRLIILKMPKG